MKSRLWSGLLLLIWSVAVAAQEPAPPASGVHLLDAVRSAISRHPALETQKQEVEINNALQKQASGAFDQLLASEFDQTRQHSPAVGAAGFVLSPTDTSQVVASYSKLFRTGVTVNGSISLNRQVDALALPGGLSTSSSQVQLVFPLLRGRGSDVTTSSERAAGAQAAGSVLDFRQVMATLITRVVSSYWSVVAADQTRAVAIASVDRGALFVDNMRALIAADQSPRSDLASVLANAADRQAARLVADQAYVQAREQLWLDMGYSLDDRQGVAALDDFSLFGELPKVADLPETAEPFIAGALARRADYLAAQTRVEANRILRDAMVNQLRPQVDFSLTAGYTALAEGRSFSNYWSAIAAGMEGPDVGGQIKYHFPVENRLASGRLAAADAQLRQAVLTRDDLARTIRSAVIASYSAVRSSLLRLERVRESVAAFQDALRNEQDKLTLGLGSIVNVLTIEDRLTNASESQVAALQSYGQALIEFRFAAGSLIPARDDLPALDQRTFTTFPFELIAGR